MDLLELMADGRRRGAGQRADARQLASWIGHSASVENLLELYATHNSRMDHVHQSLLLDRLAKLHSTKSDQSQLELKVGLLAKHHDELQEAAAASAASARACGLEAETVIRSLRSRIAELQVSS